MVVVVVEVIVINTIHLEAVEVEVEEAHLNTLNCDEGLNLGDGYVIIEFNDVNSNSGVDIQSHCDSYTWIDGNTNQL